MSTVEIEMRASVMVLWLNRPERRNALSDGLIRDLLAALDEAESDPAVRAVVLAGRGKTFCAGGDLSGGFGGDGGLVAGEQARGRFARLMARLPAFPKPVVAAVHGAALGGGLGLMAAADLAVVDAEARVGTPEIRVGLFPMIILAALRRCVPRKALMELVLTGERIDAEAAVGCGLANHVAPAGEAVDRAVELAARVGDRSLAVLALGKAAFETVEELSYGRALDVMNGRLTVNLLTEDAAEGMAAFVEKRPPAWRDR